MKYNENESYFCPDDGHHFIVNSVLQRSLVAYQNRIHASISYTAGEKYLHFADKYPWLLTRIPQSMFASYLGMTPETLSRVRNHLSKK